jgi:hypothetical protein
MKMKPKILRNGKGKGKRKRRDLQIEKQGTSLSAGASVSKAARAAGYGRATVYEWRRSIGKPSGGLECRAVSNSPYGR